MYKTICVYSSSSDAIAPEFFAVAEELGAALAGAGYGLIYGGARVGLMGAVARAREGALKPHLKPGHRAIASINSPMQCMMKEICAQCLQPQKDPATGEETIVFSCFNQDQALDRVDFAALHERLVQNSVEEKLGALWIDRCLKDIGRREAAE